MVTLCLKAIAVAIPGSAEADNAAILAARSEWARTLVQPQPVANVHARDRTPDRPLTVGYISSFFDRENWMKPVWGLINEHDRDLFGVRIFSFGPVPGGEKPGEGVDTAWRPHESDRIFDVAGLSNEGLAAVIVDEKVDLLVDLNGYSDTDRLGLFMLRPAPVIIGWFNMYATTAMPCYDYLIGDRHVVRPEEEVHYSERVARVGGSYLTFRVGYRVAGRRAAAVRRPGSSDVWLAVLAIQDFTRGNWRLERDPASLSGDAVALAQCGVGKRDGARIFGGASLNGGASVARGLIFLARAPHFEFIETYARIDIALDTFPYNGGTTTTEAIWQGVPVVAFAGSDLGIAHQRHDPARRRSGRLGGRRFEGIHRAGGSMGKRSRRGAKLGRASQLNARSLGQFISLRHDQVRSRNGIAISRDVAKLVP